MIKRLLLLLALLTAGLVQPVVPTSAPVAASIASAPVATSIAASIAAVVSSPATAETFSSPMAQTGWSYASGTATASSVTIMHMLMQSSTIIKKGHWYRITGSCSGCASGGELRAFAGYSMPAAPTGSWVTLASTSDIADNFTTSLGLTSSGANPKVQGGPGDSSEEGGAFRFACTHAKFGLEDPVVYPGMASGHLHEFTGNTAIDRYTTTTTIRTKGMSTCGDPNDALHPVNRSAYWWPAIIDVAKGALVKVSGTQDYYKMPSDPTVRTSGSVTGSIAGTTLTVTAAALPIVGHGEELSGTGITAHTSVIAQLTGTPFGVGTYTITPSQTASSTTITVESPFTADGVGPAGDITGNCASHTPAPHTCVNIPRGMKYVSGFNKATGFCGPTDLSSGCPDSTGFAFQCHSSAASLGTAIGPLYTSMEAARTSGNCAVGGQLRIALSGKGCWDGVNIDSPDHRSHVGGGNVCDSSTPIRINGFSTQNWYTIDQDFMDGNWKLTSDEMVATCAGAAVVAGCTAHLDYMWGWSPTASATWYDRCILSHNSCSVGELGDGTRMKMGGGMNPDGSEMSCNGCSLPRPDRYVPTRLFGMGPNIKTNGAFSVVIRAADDGVWGLMGLDGLTATVTGVTIVEIPSGAHGTVTVTGSGGMAANDNFGRAVNDNFGSSLRTGSMR